MVATAISKILNVKSGTVLIAVLAASAIDALPAVAGPQRLAHVAVSEVTRPPVGWIEFCARQPGECAGTGTAPRHLALSAEAWKDLVRVNKSVNKTIKPLTDLEHWGLVERWSYPDDGYGDCGRSSVPAEQEAVLRPVRLGARGGLRQPSSAEDTGTTKAMPC